MTDSTQNKLFTVHHLRVEDIDPDPDQPRSSLTGIDELAASIQAFGQLQPITVRATGNRYRIIGGERRWTATKQLGLETIAAFVAESDDAEVALIEMADNMHVPLTPDEISRGTQRAFTFDAPIERIVAATGAKPDVIERARRGYVAVSDPAVSETMSIEHLAALDEFADDPEAYDTLVAADARRWEGVARDLRMARKAQEAYEAAVEVVKASGVELLEKRAHDRQHLGKGSEKPEGAEAAYVVAYNWNASADIVWYGAVYADGTPDSEAVAETKRKMAEREELEARSVARLEFMAERLAMASALRDLADDAWHHEGAFTRPKNSDGDGLVASARALAGTPFEDVHGLATRMTASVLVAVETNSQYALVMDWQREKHGKSALAYFRVLDSIGYQPSEVEAAAIAELTAAMKPKRKAKKEAAE